LLNDIYVNRWGSWCSIVVFLVSSGQFLLRLLQPPSGLTNLAGLPRLQAVLFVGLAASALHGILWALAERTFHWNFGAGGGDSLPSGWSAVILSLTMTIPLVCLPPLYAWFMHSQLVLPGHVFASFCVVGSAASAHIFLYGAKSINFPGIKNIIFPLNSTVNWRRALLMESVYAAAHFSSVVLVYKVLIESRSGPLTARVVFPVLISAAVWLSGACIFIFLKYPDSLVDKRSVEVRGIIHALMLILTLEGGMLM